MNRIVSLVISICLCFCSAVYAEVETVKVSLNSPTITLDGTGFVPGVPLNMVVYAPSFSGDNTNESNIAASVRFTCELVPTGEDGSFTLSFNLPESDTKGRYTYVFKNKYNDYSNSFYYLSKAGIEDICDEFNGEQSDFTGLLETYSDESEKIINIIIDSKYYGSDNKIISVISANIIAIRDALNESAGFKTLAEIENTYNEAVMLYEINNASNTEVISLFDANKSTIGITDEEFYEGNKAEIATLFIGLRNEQTSTLQSIDKVKELYAESCFVREFNITENILSMDDFIKENAALLGITKAKYESYTEPTLGAILTGKVASSYETVKSLVVDAMTARDNETNNTRPGQTSSKSSGGGGSVFVAPTVSQQTTQQQQTAEPVTFDDLAEASWAKEAIVSLSGKKIVSGKGNGKFAPNDSVLREELVKMVVNTFSIHTEAGDSGFSDVGNSEWYATYIKAAVSKKIVSGIGDGIFGTGRNVTRQDAAVMLYRAAKTMNLTLPEIREYAEFADETLIAGYASEAVKALYKANIINGMENGTFAPENICTRAQVAKMLYDISGLLGEVK